MDRLNQFIDNEGCVGRSFTAWLEEPDTAEEGSADAVFGRFGQILYMHGEPVMVTGIDERKKLVAMRNGQNTEGYEDFAIPFSQFTRDFGAWPPVDTGNTH